jgi:hypothetical protein
MIGLFGLIGPGTSKDILHTFIHVRYLDVNTSTVHYVLNRALGSLVPRGVPSS